MSSNCRVVVLISGGGSNLQALIDQASDHYQIVGVLSNKADAFGLIRAQDAKIDTAVINHKNFEHREAFDAAMAERIEQWEPDIVILAGFMRILTAEFVERFQGRMLNIHPSLLPKYPGLDTHTRAITAKDTQHGVTVHFVTAELDSGPNIVQAVLDISIDDTPASLQAKVHQQEHKIYPLAVQWFAQNRLFMTSAHSATLDGQLLPESGQQIMA